MKQPLQCSDKETIANVKELVSQQVFSSGGIFARTVQMVGPVSLRDDIAIVYPRPTKIDKEVHKITCEADLYFITPIDKRIGHTAYQIAAHSYRGALIDGEFNDVMRAFWHAWNKENGTLTFNITYESQVTDDGNVFSMDTLDDDTVAALRIGVISRVYGPFQ